MECGVHCDFGCRTHHGFLNNCSFCAHTPSSSSSSSFSSPSSSSFDPSGSSASVESSGIDNGRGENGFRSLISGIFVKLIATILAFIFALVGSLIGAFTGALLGRATESGVFRGAGIGAISGAVFAIEVFESSLSSWHSDQLGIWNVMIEVDLIPGLLSGRLVREQVGSAMLSAVESQMSALDTTFDDVHDIFETGGAKSMPQDLVEKLPKIKITSENIVDASGDKICCAVCLQDFREGETARSLPLCQHMFHISCIDSWLVRNGSCPLCRQDL